jgi:hypothetical protein
MFVPTLVKTKLPISLNLVKHVFVHVEPIYVLHVQNDQLVELVFILHVQIVIPPDIFKQHLPKIFFQAQIGEMEIDETHAWIRVQNLYITRWIVIKK